MWSPSRRLDFPHGVGTYGIVLARDKRAPRSPTARASSCRCGHAPNRYQLPATPKLQAAASALNGAAPLFYDAADTEPGGSSLFAVTYDVSSVQGAKNAIIEFSRPTVNFASALFFTGNFGPTNTFVNNSTNPNGDRLDGGDNFGQAGETTHVAVPGKAGAAVLDGAAVGLSIPANACDSTYQVRVLATDGSGRIVGVASNGSILGYADFSRRACSSPPPP